MLSYTVVSNEIDDLLAICTSKMISRALYGANNGVYTSEQMLALEKWLSPEALKQRVAGSIAVFFILDTPVAVGVTAPTLFGWEINTLYVSPDSQRQGIGFGLVNLLESYAADNNARLMSLCSVNFPSTIQFYQHMGYSTLGQITHVIEEVPISFMAMQKELR